MYGRSSIRIGFRLISAPQHEDAVYRWWWSGKSVSAERSYATHFYGDKGWNLNIGRFFGDTEISLFAKVQSQGDKAAGLSISLPLTPKKAFTVGPLAVTGSPRWAFSKATTFDTASGCNTVRPLLLIEHQPEYNLAVDWLDSGRVAGD